MHIAIDARFWGIEHTGLGRYTMQLITHLAKIDSNNQYSLIIHPAKQTHIAEALNQAENFTIYYSTARPYTLKEQIEITQILHTIKPDLAHVPHFNISIFTKVPLVTTIHDLITLQSKGLAATTLPGWQYHIKWLVHKQVISRAIAKSHAIITPSLYTKGQIMSYFKKSESHIYVTYEAPDHNYFDVQPEKIKSPEFPYFVYTGNAYPHKNLDRLLQAFVYLRDNYQTNANLAIVSSRGVFQERINQLINRYQLKNNITFYHHITDRQLANLYQNSIAFVTPSLLEGFGLPGLEAMAAQTLVLSSDASCLPEIYDQYALYFDPYSVEDIAVNLNKALIMPTEEREKIIQAALLHAQTFSWSTMAQQTHDIYHSVFESLQ